MLQFCCLSALSLFPLNPKNISQIELFRVRIFYKLTLDEKYERFDWYLSWLIIFIFVLLLLHIMSERNKRKWGTTL